MNRTFRVFILGLAALACFAQTKPTAIFPSAVVTDARLKIAANRLSTTLASGVTAGATSMTLTSATGVAINSLLSIYAVDSRGAITGAVEIVSVDAAPSGNVLPSVTRGYDGTTAAAHGSGASVAGFVVAWHHNALVAEVEAIESALGTVIVSTPYNFTALTPGGTLTGGGGNQVVTLATCPQGIVTSGTFATALYISAGTGTSEWLRPSGGSCTSGATNGTVIISPANNHSGAWTVTSATAGIDLACASSSMGAAVVVPPGHYNIYGTIRPSTGCTINGLGMPSTSGPSGAVFLHLQTAGIPLIDIAAFAVTIKNLQLAYGTYSAYTVGGVAATAGSIGIQTGVTAGVDQPIINNVVANNFYVNFKFWANAIYVDHAVSQRSVSHGFLIGALGSGYMLNVLSETSGGDGYHITTGCAALQWETVTGFANFGWSIYAEDSVAFQMDDLDLEGDSLGGISVGNTGVSAILQNVIIQLEGPNPFGSTVTTAPGISVRAGTTSSFLSLTNAQISSNEGNGLEILAGAGVNVGNSYFYSNGAGAQANKIYNVYSLGEAQFNNLITYYSPVYINAANNRLSHNTFNFTGMGGCGTGGVIFGASATRTLFDGNDIDCAMGGGAAIVYTAGSTFAAGGNHLSAGATVTGTPVSDYSMVYTNVIRQLPVLTALTVSSNAITVTLPVHHVGAGLIKTITTAGSVPVCFSLIADSAFTTDTTGNILTPAITATVGKLYQVCYDPATTKMYFTN